MKMIPMHLFSICFGLIGGACSSALMSFSHAKDEAGHASSESASGVVDLVRTRRLEIVGANDIVLGTFAVGKSDTESYQSVELVLGRQRGDHALSRDGIRMIYAYHFPTGSEEWRGYTDVELASFDNHASTRMSPGAMEVTDDSYLSHGELGRKGKLGIQTTGIVMYKGTSKVVQLGYTDEGFTKGIPFSGLVFRDEMGRERILLRTDDWDIEAPELRFKGAAALVADKVYPGAD